MNFASRKCRSLAPVLKVAAKRVHVVGERVYDILISKRHEGLKKKTLSFQSKYRGRQPAWQTCLVNTLWVPLVYRLVPTKVSVPQGEECAFFSPRITQCPKHQGEMSHGPNSGVLNSLSLHRLLKEISRE